MARYESELSSQIRRDLDDVYGTTVHVNLLPDMHRTGRKPYDFYFFYENFYAVELKLESGRSFNVKNKVKPHQPDSLRMVIEAKGCGFFCISFNRYKTAFILTPDRLEIMTNKFGQNLKYDMFVEEQNVMTMERKKFDKITRWEVEKFVEASNVFSFIRSKSSI